MHKFLITAADRQRLQNTLQQIQAGAKRLDGKIITSGAQQVTLKKIVSDLASLMAESFFNTLRRKYLGDERVADKLSAAANIANTMQDTLTAGDLQSNDAANLSKELRETVNAFAVNLAQVVEADVKPDQDDPGRARLLEVIDHYRSYRRFFPADNTSSMGKETTLLFKAPVVVTGSRKPMLADLKKIDAKANVISGYLVLEEQVIVGVNTHALRYEGLTEAQAQKLALQLVGRKRDAKLQQKLKGTSLDRIAALCETDTIRYLTELKNSTDDKVSRDLLDFNMTRGDKGRVKRYQHSQKELLEIVLDRYSERNGKQMKLLSELPTMTQGTGLQYYWCGTTKLQNGIAAAIGGLTGWQFPM